MHFKQLYTTQGSFEFKSNFLDIFCLFTDDADCISFPLFIVNKSLFCGWRLKSAPIPVSQMIFFFHGSATLTKIVRAGNVKTFPEVGLKTLKKKKFSSASSSEWCGPTWTHYFFFFFFCKSQNTFCTSAISLFVFLSVLFLSVWNGLGSIGMYHTFRYHTSTNQGRAKIESEFDDSCGGFFLMSAAQSKKYNQRYDMIMKHSWIFKC